MLMYPFIWTWKRSLVHGIIWQPVEFPNNKCEIIIYSSHMQHTNGARPRCHCAWGPSITLISGIQVNTYPCGHGRAVETVVDIFHTFFLLSWLQTRQKVLISLPARVTWVRIHRPSRLFPELFFCHSKPRLIIKTTFHWMHLPSINHCWWIIPKIRKSRNPQSCGCLLINDPFQNGR